MERYKELCSKVEFEEEVCEEVKKRSFAKDAVGSLCLADAAVTCQEGVVTKEQNCVKYITVQIFL